MTIHLPDDLSQSVLAAARTRPDATTDDLVAEIVRDYFRNRPQPDASDPSALRVAHQPLWEIIEDENRAIPPELWDALPADLSAEHDHYVYGTPKRNDP
jgi:hypothetical protein